MQPGKPGGLPHVSPTGPTNIDVPKQEEMTAYTVDDKITVPKICGFDKNAYSQNHVALSKKNKLHGDV